MAYCPLCKYEYRKGVEICPECNEPLVKRSQVRHTAAVQPDDSWVVVAGVSSTMESQLVRGSLDSNNIPSVTMSSDLAPVISKEIPVSFAATRGNDGKLVLVPRDFLEEAVLLLRAVLGEDFEEPEAR